MMTIKELLEGALLKDRGYSTHKNHVIRVFECHGEFLITITNNKDVILPIYHGRSNRVFDSKISAFTEGVKLIDTYLEKGYLS